MKNKLAAAKKVVKGVKEDILAECGKKAKTKHGAERKAGAHTVAATPSSVVLQTASPECHSEKAVGPDTTGSTTRSPSAPSTSPTLQQREAAFHLLQAPAIIPSTSAEAALQRAMVHEKHEEVEVDPGPAKVEQRETQDTVTYSRDVIPPDVNGGFARIIITRTTTCGRTGHTVQESEERLVQTKYWRMCNVPGCATRATGKVLRQPDAFGDKGPRCGKHGMVRECNVYDCKQQGKINIPNEDAYGPAGRRCRRHGAFAQCVIPDCPKFPQGRISVPDELGPEGLRCYEHGGRHRCSVRGCEARAVEPRVDEEDKFGRAGLRCGAHR